MLFTFVEGHSNNWGEERASEATVWDGTWGRSSQRGWQLYNKYSIHLWYFYISASWDPMWDLPMFCLLAGDCLRKRKYDQKQPASPWPCDNCKCVLLFIYSVVLQLVYMLLLWSASYLYIHIRGLHGLVSLSIIAVQWPRNLSCLAVSGKVWLQPVDGSRFFPGDCPVSSPHSADCHHMSEIFKSVTLNFIQTNK